MEALAKQLAHAKQNSVSVNKKYANLKTPSRADIEKATRQRIAELEKANVSFESIERKLSSLESPALSAELQAFVQENAELQKLQPKITVSAARQMQSLLSSMREIQAKIAEKGSTKTKAPQWDAVEAQFQNKEIVRNHKKLYDRLKARKAELLDAQPRPVNYMKNEVISKVLLL